MSQVSLSGCGRRLVAPAKKHAELPHLRALADSRGDTLDRIRPDILDGEDTRRLVSSGRRPSSPPVNTNPFASSATPDPDSHVVFGSAPMKRNR